MGVDKGKHALWLKIMITVTWFLVTVAVDVETCRYRKWSKPGTLTVQVIAGVHEPTQDGKCSNTISKAVASQLVILDLMTDILNGKTDFSDPYIPGNTFGKYAQCY